MEILLQILLEPIFFAYLDLVEKFLGSKHLKSWQTNLLKVLCLSVSVVSIFLVIIGIFFIMDTQPFITYGKIMLIIGGSILLIHVLIAIFVGANRFIDEKRKNALGA